MRRGDATSGQSGRNRAARGRRGYLGAASAFYVLSALVVLAVTNAGTFFALRVLDRQAKERPADGALTVSQSELDFGEVWLQKDFQWPVTLRNGTNARVDIENIRASCSCTSVAPTSGIIEPGAVLDVALTLNLAPRNPWQAREASRLFAADLIVRTRQKVEYSWQIRGMVKSLLTFNPIVLDFGEIIDAEAASKTQTLDVESYAPLAKVEARCGDDRFLTRVEAVSSKHWKVEVTPGPVVPSGRFGTTLYLRAFRADQAEVPPVPVEMTGVITPDVHLSPSSVFLGRGSQSADVTVSSHVGRRIAKVEMDERLPSGIRIVRVDTSREGSPCFRVECRERPAQTATGDVRFTLLTEGDNEPTLASLSVVVQGGGTDEKRERSGR